uniref:40S ribosomal protein S27 n=1 Tax=Hucho hucho TaxID=62062 RepID=A0A4W5KN79_9TELE
MPLAKDLLHPTSEEEKRSHKKKRLVQSPNSYFMDVKCPGCYKITTVFSHAQTVVLCVGCSTVLCQPTGGKARLTEDRCASEWSLTFTAAPCNTPWTDEADTQEECVRPSVKLHILMMLIQEETALVSQQWSLLDRETQGRRDGIDPPVTLLRK